MKMGPQDEPEAFVDLFEKTAEACDWVRTQWPVLLIPLLTGEAQVAPFSSLRQSLGSPSAAGVAGRPGPVCWRCGNPGHFHVKRAIQNLGH